MRRIVVSDHPKHRQRKPSSPKPVLSTLTTAHHTITPPPKKNPPQRKKTNATPRCHPPKPSHPRRPQPRHLGPRENMDPRPTDSHGPPRHDAPRVRRHAGTVPAGVLRLPGARVGGRVGGGDPRCRVQPVVLYRRAGDAGFAPALVGRWVCVCVGRSSHERAGRHLLSLEPLIRGRRRHWVRIELE
ncbi:hypothetical protein BT67DRAFT_169293 [Trichocladium antarcticum]|uniref:Uncharacterized protein n=1 Tax=Trichocladium antarcticum TaxID=1450529 RepID=A0AAN6ZAP8_9PEZI|nr:hypothetical protein BT67DRAFT_169293 [Trichocladium antarcticum]